MNKYYVTTPIYYVNDKPHIGTTYTTVVADALARFHRLKKEDVYFVTGTDENSQKNLQAMEKAGDKDLPTYLDRMAGVWKDTWSALGISNDDFIRTTETRHLDGVRRFWKAVKKSGDIYEGEYTGLYCVGCEAFKAESDLVNGACALHPNAELQTLKEKNYFFRLTAYREELLALYETNEQFVMPESRRHEVRNYVRDHLTDISISREAKALEVGIPVPDDESQKIYVWFDALINYLTAVGYGTNEELFKKFWPADLHLVGKDIIKFHCALWPAMLLSAAKSDALLQDEKGTALLPCQVFAHGFFTIDGQKISKSLGNAIDPRELIQQYPFDVIRYYLLREITFGEDGDFSRERLAERYSADLANTLGNLVQRVIAMSRKYFDGKVPATDVDAAAISRTDHWKGESLLREISIQASEWYEQNRCDKALAVIWEGLDEANKYIEDTQPFKLVKEDEKAVSEILYALLESCRFYGWLIHPVLPETSVKIFSALGLDPEEELEQAWNEALQWGGLPTGSQLPAPEPLFPKIEKEAS